MPGDIDLRSSSRKRVSPRYTSPLLKQRKTTKSPRKTQKEGEPDHFNVNVLATPIRAKRPQYKLPVPQPLLKGPRTEWTRRKKTEYTLRKPKRSRRGPIRINLEDSDKGSNTGIWVVLGILFFLLVVGGIVLAFYFGGKKDLPGEQAVQTTGNNASSNHKQDYNPDKAQLVRDYKQLPLRYDPRYEPVVYQPVQSSTQTQPAQAQPITITIDNILKNPKQSVVHIPNGNRTSTHQTSAPQQRYQAPPAQRYSAYGGTTNTHAQLNTPYRYGGAGGGTGGGGTIPAYNNTGVTDYSALINGGGTTAGAYGTDAYGNTAEVNPNAEGVAAEAKEPTFWQKAKPYVKYVFVCGIVYALFYQAYFGMEAACHPEYGSNEQGAWTKSYTWLRGLGASLKGLIGGKGFAKDSICVAYNHYTIRPIADIALAPVKQLQHGNQLDNPVKMAVAWKMNWVGKWMGDAGAKREDLADIQIGSSVVSAFLGGWILHRLYPDTAFNAASILFTIGQWMGYMNGKSYGLVTSLIGGLVTIGGVITSAAVAAPTGGASLVAYTAATSGAIGAGGMLQKKGNEWSGVQLPIIPGQAWLPKPTTPAATATAPVTAGGGQPRALQTPIGNATPVVHRASA